MDDETLATGDALGRIGSYAVEGVLGRGGMGVVVRARAPSGRLVAVKSIRPDRLTPALAARFEREATIRIDHPNVVQMLDAGVDEGGAPFIVFELLEGTSLDARLQKERVLAPAEVVRILVQACAGLEAAHARGIIHRDLKPANVFLCTDGTVKLLDFGIAFVHSASRLTGDATVLGTPAYLSPEQARGVRDLDGRTDVWALGVLAYEALSGRLPFDREPALVLLLSIIQDEFVPLREIAPQVPEELAEIVHGCLTKSPADRWPSAAALAAALATVEAGEERPRVSRLPARAPSATSLRPDEVRVVVVLLARDVADVASVEDIIRARGGDAIPLLGGDVIGVFGAGTWRGDEARRAASAGLALRHLAERVAIASGRARADAGGIAGEGLVWAHEMAQIEVDGVAVEPRTARTLGESFLFGDRGDERFVEVLAEVGDDSLADDAEPVTLAGRSAELAVLADALEASRERATAVVLAGPAGIGKTRLRQEIARMIVERSPSTIVLVGGAEPFGHEGAYASFATALRRHARRVGPSRGWPPLRADAPPFARNQAVLAVAREALPDRAAAQQCAEQLGVLLGVSASRDPRGVSDASRDPELMSDRMRLALLDYLGGLLARGPVALLLEDLQWADDATLALLRELPRRFAEARLFVLATLRGSSADLDLGPSAVRLDLGGLGLTEVRAIAERAAGVAPPEPLARALAERTEGNPLFVEQIAATLGDRAASDQSGAALPLPFTVEAAVQARLDDLPDGARDACRAASIFGRAMTVTELAVVYRPDGEGSDAAAMLEILEASGLVEASVGGGAAGGREHRFRSALVAEIAYRTIAAEARAALHLRLAEHLARREDADREETAVHFERAGDQRRAAAAYAHAAIEAARTGATERALRCSDRAIELGTPDALRFALHAARADTFRFLRRRAEQSRELDEALRAASTPAERARALLEQSALTARLGDHATALTLAERAVDEAARGGEAETHALAIARRAQVLALAGDHERARASVAEAVERAAACDVRVRAVVAEIAALEAYLRGDLGAALDGFAEAARLFAEAGDVRRAAANEGNLADFYNRVGDHAAAEVALRDALEGCRRVGNRVYEGYVLANLGHALERAGRAAEAIAPLAEAEAVCEETHDARLRAAVLAYRARAYLALGRATDALAECDGAVDHARRASQSALAAAADALGARIEIALGHLDRALSRSASALAVRDSLGGAGEDDAYIFLARVLALRAAGELDEAEATRARGAARVREIAAGISRGDWRARFLTGVEENRALLEEPSPAAG